MLKPVKQDNHDLQDPAGLRRQLLSLERPVQDPGLITTLCEAVEKAQTTVLTQVVLDMTMMLKSSLVSTICFYSVQPQIV